MNLNVILGRGILSAVLLLMFATSSSGQSILSTDFTACGLPRPVNPQPVNVDPAAMARTFKGVWLGTHTEMDGSVTPENYIMIFDTDASNGIAFQQLNVQENAFAQLFPPASPSAAKLAFLFCGGQGYTTPFRDTFVKISRDPRQGLAALQNVTGVPVGSLNVQQAWQALINMGFFTNPSALTTTAALYSMKFTAEQNLTLPLNDTQVSFGGEYRGSPSKFIVGQPILGAESGRFQGVGQAGSTIAVSIGIEPWAATCTGTTSAPLQYFKAVAWPLAPQICDSNGDGQIDLTDINAIFQARDTAATNPDDPRDADGDGIITTNDARRCVLQCTFAGCATARMRTSGEKDVLASLIDNALTKIETREVRSDIDSPWILMHYLLASGGSGTVYDSKNHERVNVVDFLLDRATAKGRKIFWDVEGVLTLPPRTEQFAVEGHVDEYVMALASAGVDPERKFSADTGRVFTVSDLVSAAQCSFKPAQELGWTLVALSHYRREGASWISDNTRYTVEDLVALAIKRDARTETEGGPHHLYGIAYAVREHNKDREYEAEGPDNTWELANKYLRGYIDLARKYQQKDGGFSGAGFWGSAQPMSPSHMVDTTGHTLEWMAVALSNEELDEDWVRLAVTALCNQILSYPVETFTKGGLYHAAHGLQLYRERLAERDAANIAPNIHGVKQ
jgi:hypothetical protein